MANIISARLLRTGELLLSSEGASSQDEWILRLDEQVSKEAVSNLWLLTPDCPTPKAALKFAAGRIMVCDQVRFSVVNAERYLWRVTVSWKDQEDSPPENQTQPMPSSVTNPDTGSTDPDDWEPTVTRRPVTVSDPAQELFYESGYTGYLGSQYAARTANNPSLRSALTNSAGVPFEDNLPPHQRKQSLITIRWVRSYIPSGLLDLELKLNSAAAKLDVAGWEFDLAEKTAKIESVQLTQTKWGDRKLWEIVVEILHDVDGHYVRILDQGMTEFYFSGDSYGGSSVTTPIRVKVKDNKGQQVPQPVLLNGAGKALDIDAGLSPKFGVWRDFELTNFLTAPLLKDVLKTP